jgi:ribosomal protein S18 acetylase RimI-like enzyme
MRADEDDLFISMTIRTLNADDAEAYQALRLRGLKEIPEAFSSDYEEEVGRSVEEMRARVTPAPDGSLCVFGAFVGGTLAGMLTFIRSARAKIRHSGELAGMYVAPEYRRQGLAGALVDSAVAYARSLPGMRQLKLGVGAANTPARALYASRGFVSFGVEPEAICVDGQFFDEDYQMLRLGGPASESVRTKGCESKG